MNYSVIMAGGRGTRFWPLSRTVRPKQFLALASKQPMIADTIDRISPVIPKKNTFVITNKKQLVLARKTSRGVPQKNIIAEPIGRNTAPCLGFAAILAEHQNKNKPAILLATPADHYVKNAKGFQSLLRKAIQEAKSSNTIVVFGIQPTYPETGYGYIEVDKKVKPGVLTKVKQFVEKPNAEKAEEYLQTKRFYWNNGIFVCRTDVLLGAIEVYLPELANQLNTIRKSLGKRTHTSVLNRVYPQMQSISMDYGIMEKYPHVKLIPASVGWSDLGSWEAIYDHRPKDGRGNVTGNQTISIESKNCMVQGDGRTIVTLGVEGLLVVATEDALLVADRKRSQDVRLITDYLEKNKKKYQKLL